MTEMIPNFDVIVNMFDRNRLEITLEDKALEPILALLVSGLASWVANDEKRSIDPSGILKAKNEVRKILEDLVDSGAIYKYCDEWHVDLEP